MACKRLLMRCGICNTLNPKNYIKKFNKNVCSRITTYSGNYHNNNLKFNFTNKVLEFKPHNSVLNQNLIKTYVPDVTDQCI